MNWLEITSSALMLTVLEIVLGIDNLVFLSLLIEKLPSSDRKKVRYWGLSFAWVARLLLLVFAVSLAGMTKPLFVVSQISLSARGIFLFLGGLFLITKATQEVHAELMPTHHKVASPSLKKKTFRWIVLQVVLMDLIFSLDSVLTAIGLTNHFAVMAMAMTIAIGVMLYASKGVGHFIKKYPTLKMLALCFLMLIGILLIADSMQFHVPRGYLYFAMGFSMAVESLNLVKRKAR